MSTYFTLEIMKGKSGTKQTFIIERFQKSQAKNNLILRFPKTASGPSLYCDKSENGDKMLYKKII